jgi:ATP-dependent helicase IRC3
LQDDQIIRFLKDFDLIEARKKAPRKTPKPHQQKAIDAFDKWFSQKDFPRGGLLVLPTGAGKTFTAVHFLHLRVLNEGYKVLWLAHTHHLLEQAFYGFSSDLSSIPEPKKHLRVRVVSGTPGHCEPRDIKPDDDVVIGTLQTIAQAYNKAQPQFLKYLEAAKGKLFVVFDERTTPLRLVIES